MKKQIVNTAYAVGDNTSIGKGTLCIKFNNIRLSVKKSTSVNSVASGESFYYTLIISNTSKITAATNVVLTNTVPDLFSVTNVTVPSGATNNTIANYVNVTIPNIAANNSATVTVNAIVL